MGDSKAIDYVSEVKKLLATGGVVHSESSAAPTPAAGNSFTLDEDF
jgi:hypothetical protein